MIGAQVCNSKLLIEKLNILCTHHSCHSHQSYDLSAMQLMFVCRDPRVFAFQLIVYFS
jgi:hypothetical protein